MPCDNVTVKLTCPRKAQPQSHEPKEVDKARRKLALTMSSAAWVTPEFGPRVLAKPVSMARLALKVARAANASVSAPSEGPRQVCSKGLSHREPHTVRCDWAAGKLACSEGE